MGEFEKRKLQRKNFNMAKDVEILIVLRAKVSVPCQTLSHLHERMSQGFAWFPALVRIQVQALFNEIQKVFFETFSNTFLLIAPRFTKDVVHRVSSRSGSGGTRLRVAVFVLVLNAMSMFDFDEILLKNAVSLCGLRSCLALRQHPIREFPTHL